MDVVVVLVVGMYGIEVVEGIVFTVVLAPLEQETSTTENTKQISMKFDLRATTDNLTHHNKPLS